MEHLQQSNKFVWNSQWHEHVCSKQQAVDSPDPPGWFLTLTRLSLYQSVCDVPPSCFTRSDDLHNLKTRQFSVNGEVRADCNTCWKISITWKKWALLVNEEQRWCLIMLPVLFLNQSIEQLGLQLESSAADFPLICFVKSYGITEKNILASGVRC